MLVPVAIHLWNRRPGREVAVGSLRWLAAGANRRLRNLKLEQLGLLLLRAALLAVLAVAVAGPVWRTALPTSRGVVLLSPEAAGLPALAGLKSTIDSLRRRGYALRWLAAGFPRVPGRTWQQLQAAPVGATADSIAASAAGQSGSQPFAWARVQQAAAAFPGQPLVVVTSAALRNFGGSHASLPAEVTWQTLPDTTTATWLASAAQTGDSLSLLVGRSNEMRTSYRRQKVRLPANGQPFQAAGLAPMRVAAAKEAGRQPVLIATAGGPKATANIAIDTAPLAIDLYASPEYAADARYLEAALRAAGTALPTRPLLRRLSARPNQLSAPLTFWLSADPLPRNWQADLRKAARTIWLEAAGPGVADTAHVATAAPDAAAVQVYRRDARPVAAGLETVWADGRGRAVLSRQAVGLGAVYQLHTRLNPAWSELADDAQLPARLLELLQPEPTNGFNRQSTRLAAAEAVHDRRALAQAQLPTTAAASARQTAAIAPPATFRQTDLRPWLVLLAGLLLLLERLLVERLLARRRDTLNLPTAA